MRNKLLYTDADMAKADWATTVATIVGVLGAGIGWWWLDGVAALFIGVGIVWDGYRNARAAVRDLIDQRARTHDDARPHPLLGEIVHELERMPWVAHAGVRMRDMGQVLHVDAFVVPRRHTVSLRRLEYARHAVAALEWKMQDASLAVVASLPDEVLTSGRDGVGERRVMILAAPPDVNPVLGPCPSTVPFRKAERTRRTRR